jgi:hypothetical protein
MPRVPKPRKPKVGCRRALLGWDRCGDGAYALCGDCNDTMRRYEERLERYKAQKPRRRRRLKNQPLTGGPLLYEAT